MTDTRSEDDNRKFETLGRVVLDNNGASIEVRVNPLGAEIWLWNGDELTGNASGFIHLDGEQVEALIRTLSSNSYFE